MDAIDVALVRFDEQTFEIVDYEQYPIAGEIRAAVRNLSINSGIEEISRLDAVLGELFADAVLRILKKTVLESGAIFAIGSHGQTILHLPQTDPPRTLQIGDPNIIAWKTGITTVSDFRRMDMAAGGQGAPLAPAFHARYFRSDKNNRVILNIGGMANFTFIPADPEARVTGFDTGPGNGLLDDWNFKCNKTYMDKDSVWAASGTINASLLSELLNDPYFALPPPKSTGREYFNLAWLERKLQGLGKTISPENVQATLLSLTALSVANAIKSYTTQTKEIYTCGGGTHNPVLIRKLQEELPDIQIASTAKIGIDPDAVEAVTFAWLAQQRLEDKPGNLPSVTGASKPVILGAVYEPVKRKNKQS